MSGDNKQRADFISSGTFAGSKEGYVFKADSKGVGYYLDIGLPGGDTETAAAAASAVAGETTPPPAPSDEQVQLETDTEGTVDLDTEATVYKAEQICPLCGENGQAVFYLTPIPHFREIIISAFSCPHCGHKNSEVQRSNAIAETGVRMEVQVTGPEDMNRQIVKSKECVLTIPELGLEIPKRSQAGTLSTIEGVLMKVTTQLFETVEALDKSGDAEGAAKLTQFCIQLAAIAQGKQFPFSVHLDDPLGDSYIEALTDGTTPDPKMKVERYQRTKEQNQLIGLYSKEELEEAAMGPDNEGGAEAEAATAEVAEFKAPKGGLLTDDSIMQMYQKADDLEAVVMKSECPACQSEGEHRMCNVTVPHFRSIILICFYCKSCGFKQAEVKPSGAVPDKGKKIVLKVTKATAAFDLGRDFVKSSSATVQIPEIGLEMCAGTLGGRYLTIEGAVVLVKEQLLSSGNFALGDSSRPDVKAKFEKFIEKMDQVLAGQIDFTFVVTDPMDSSWIYNKFAPKEDPQMTETYYTRSAEEDEELGLDEMNAPEFCESESDDDIDAMD